MMCLVRWREGVKPLTVRFGSGVGGRVLTYTCEALVSEYLRD